MKKLLIVPLAALLFLACGNSQPKLAEGETLVTFVQGVTTAVFTNHLDSLADSRTFVLDAKEGQTLVARIATNTMPANVRIHQLIGPAGAAEGPFGPEVTYTFPETGRWKLIVAESNMVGEPYVGAFTLTVEVK